MRRPGIAVILALSLGACSAETGPTYDKTSPGPAPQTMPAVVPLSALPIEVSDTPGDGPARAVFAEFPAQVFANFQAGCADPGESILRPSRNEVQCLSLPPVEAAAALILEFDGTYDDLPRHVASLKTRTAPDGVLVIADSYVRVPQQAGGTAILRLPDPAIVDLMEQQLVRAGGTLR